MQIIEHSGWKTKINVRFHLARHLVHWLIFFWINVFSVLNSSFCSQVIGTSMCFDQLPLPSNCPSLQSPPNCCNFFFLLIQERKFCHVFCFLDDLCAINDDSELEKNFKDIYPEKLEFKNGKASFLNLLINIGKKGLAPLYMTKGMLSNFLFSVCLTAVAICHLKHFVHPLPLKL